MKILTLLIISLLTTTLIVWIHWYKPKYIFKTDKGYEHITNAKIQPDEAIKLAEPYLDKIFEKKSKNRNWPSIKESQTVIHIILKGNYYYITKENYPAKDIYFYMRSAVKIHKKSGEIIIEKNLCKPKN